MNKKPKFLIDFDDIHKDQIERCRQALINSYWHEKQYRSNFSEKIDDFKLSQGVTETVLDTLEQFIDMAQGDRSAVGVQPYINNMVKIINLHLNKIKEHYEKPFNLPKSFQKKETQRDQVQFQTMVVFKGQQKIKSKLRNLNIDNNMDNLTIEFFDGKLATIPMRKVLCSLLPEVEAKVGSLNIDWDLIMDNGFFINMRKTDIPVYNVNKHFWDQEIHTLQFYVSEYNKIINGVTIDGYHFSGWLYFTLNYFKTPIGDKDDEILNPDFRDNEYYWEHINKLATERNKTEDAAADILFGTRRWSKSTCESSECVHKIIISPSKNGTIISSNTKDLDALTDKVKIGLDYIHPAFKISTNARDWNKLVKFGLKTKSQVELKFFYLTIINTEGGSTKGSEKTAGGAPVVFIYDEAGKDAFINAHNAAQPSFATSNGWKVNPKYTGTGGENDLSADAEKVLSNPKAYGFAEMDWDFLEGMVPEGCITWKRRPFGYFLPAQMGYKAGNRKIKMNFADFLGIESEELSKITIYKTDWEHNKKVCERARDKVKGDTSQLQKEKVYYPIDPEECFLSANNNPYASDGLQLYQKKLKLEGDPKYGKARRVVLDRRKETREVYMEMDTSREVNVHPHKGGFIDSPVLLYDNFPETPPTDPYRFVGGLDDYRHQESKGESVGAFYIYDRLKRKIVLSLATRPSPHSKFHDQILMALDAYNAKVFMENADMLLKDYIERVRLNPNDYLYKAFDAYADFESNKFQSKRKYGWQPDKNTTPIVRGYTIQYIEDHVDFYDDSNNYERTVYGYERVDDVQLLEEMIRYKKGGNYDRLVAFGSCLAIDHYLTANYITPLGSNKRSGRTRSTDEDRPRKKRKLKYFSIRRLGYL